jgi:hypothetical protein
MTRQKKMVQSMPDLLGEGLSMADCCDGSVVTNWQDVGGAYAGLTKRMAEPVQGCAADCFFMAALKAVALKASGTLMRDASRFSFLNTETMTVEDKVLNNIQIAFDRNRGNPVYARSTSAYHWPLLYEKAYALWVDSKNPKQHWDPIDTTQPDIKTIFKDGGNGVAAIMHITRYNNRHEKEPLDLVYPCIAATENLLSDQLRLPDQLKPKHTYTVSRVDANYYYLIDPCDSTNSSKRLAIANLTTTNFETWGYARP